MLEDRPHGAAEAMKPRLRLKLWLEPPNSEGFGPGFLGLLEGVERWGSLSEAARRAHMSYRHAWDLIRLAESGLGTALVESRSGGSGGGGMRVTPAGQALTHRWRALRDEVERFAARTFEDLFPDEDRPSMDPDVAAEVVGLEPGGEDHENTP
jgi:molybdate transport system regulatory protein